MKIILPGGSGQIGQFLARHFLARGHEVVVLCRGAAVPSGRTEFWDGRSLGAWAAEFDHADIVINLAGRTVNCRYTPENLEQMMNSRVDSTRVVGEAIEKAKNPPKLWLQMSTATIYAHRFDAANDEVTGIIGGQEKDVPSYWGYSVEVAKNWEKTLDAANTPHTRKVALRASMVMSPDRDGIFDVMSRLVRFGLGGSAAGGKQFVSWIHDRDFIRAIEFLIAHEDISGPVNIASPGPLPYNDFMRAMRRAWGMPIGLPAMKWMLEIGAWVMRTDTELVLKSRRVIPGRLLEQGFAFEYSDWDEAVKDLVTRWRTTKQS
jgi:uncharacterized protein